MPLTQARVATLARGPGAVILCGRFEGVDERIIEARNFSEVSIGDYVLSGGEVAASVLIDACVRLLPGVMGQMASADEESFSQGLLEYPQYTRPQLFEGRGIPEVLTSGDHAKVAAWRRAEAERLTRERRPDLWAGAIRSARNPDFRGLPRHGHRNRQSRPGSVEARPTRDQSDTTARPLDWRCPRRLPMNLIQELEKEQVAKLTAGKEIPDFQPGDTVIVNVKIVEGDKARVQAYEGVCIGRAGAGLQENFTVRKISYGEGVERVFPLYSPMIDSIKVVRRGKVRRAKLYYLRGLRGKRARITEKQDHRARRPTPTDDGSAMIAMATICKKAGLLGLFLWLAVAGISAGHGAGAVAAGAAPEGRHDRPATAEEHAAAAAAPGGEGRSRPSTSARRSRSSSSPLAQRSGRMFAELTENNIGRHAGASDRRARSSSEPIIREPIKGGVGPDHRRLHRSRTRPRPGRPPEQRRGQGRGRSGGLAAAIRHFSERL